MDYSKSFIHSFIPYLVGTYKSLTPTWTDINKSPTLPVGINILHSFSLHCLKVLWNIYWLTGFTTEDGIAWLVKSINEYSHVSNVNSSISGGNADNFCFWLYKLIHVFPHPLLWDLSQRSITVSKYLVWGVMIQGVVRVPNNSWWPVQLDTYIVGTNLISRNTEHKWLQNFITSNLDRHVC